MDRVEKWSKQLYKTEEVEIIDWVKQKELVEQGITAFTTENLPSRCS